MIARLGSACNPAVVVLLFGGYSGHDLYRATWHTFGAMSAAVFLLDTKKAEAPAAVQERKRLLPAWSADFGAARPAARPVEPWLPVAEVGWVQGNGGGAGLMRPGGRA